MTEPAGTEVATVDDTKQMLAERERRALEIDFHRGMGMTPEQYKRERTALLHFVNEQLEEAVYDGRKIVKVNDYYKIGDKKALSRRGADSTAEFFGLKIMDMVEVRASLEKDHVSVTERCTVHRSGIIRGVREASCNSAEATFQRSANKYKVNNNLDWRAAENDIRARAQKRAYVQAVIHAVCGADILEVADDTDFNGIPEAEYEEVATGADALFRRMQSVLETCLEIKVLTKDEVEKFVVWANKDGRKHEKIEEQLVLLEDRLSAQDENQGPFS